MDTASTPGMTARTSQWKLTLAYDGGDFQGWQVQPGLRTIQGTLAETVERIFGVAAGLPQGSGRTDTGVHAEAQVVSLQLPVTIAPERLLHVLNRRLPTAIRVTAAEQVAPEFHARAGVRAKTYEYRIFERLAPDNTAEHICPPTLARYVWDCRWILDLERLQSAAALVAGTHDFTSFTANDPARSARLRQQGEPPDANVRTVLHSAWQRCGGLLRYQVSGNGFLHHMVRNLVGTFIDIARNTRPPETVLDILHARDRRAAGPTAPAQGLFLMRVDYDDESPPQRGTPAITAAYPSAAHS